LVIIGVCDETHCRGDDPEAEVAARIATLGEEITARYQGSEEVVMIGLLRGSCVFLADLCRQCQLPITLDFMTASSYGSGMHSTRDVRILKDLDDDIKGKDVVIVEDIIDTGYTLNKVREILSCASRNPWPSAPCWTNRPAARFRCRWTGLVHPGRVRGGLWHDYAQKYRNLPFIGKAVPQE
jgi:hypoxanthine phosphoribosyltransferase